MLDDRVRAVLRRLEEETASEPSDAPRSARSLQIAPTSGALLFALCAGRAGCEVLEIGGSRGYSTIWLGAAVRLHGGHVTSLEGEPAKLEASGRNIGDAGLEEWIDVVAGDAFASLASLDGPYDVVFLDAWKDDYEALFELARARVEVGAVIVADNVVSHDELAAYSTARQDDPTLVSVTVPMDNGLEVATVIG
ncbi:MAG TPA: class I SAM-dependent methyltransferase [Gaiellaceae bacterium]|jgi:predicted O-methyltransferase YrrM|nr:class I SAM-dependent methyltransferase [Gaiellaceae bacterium]